MQQAATSDPYDILRAWARSQAGALSRAQALSKLSRRTVDREVARGRWTQLHPKLLCLNLEPTWLTWAWGGVLLGGSGASVGAAAALRLEGLIDHDPLPVRVYTRRQIAAPPRELELVRGHRSCTGRLPRTTTAASLIDSWPEIGNEAMLVAVGRALQLRRTSEKALRRELDDRARVPRRRQLERLLGLGADGVHSPLERAHAELERAHGLPISRRQVRTPHGVLDALHGDFGVAIELDGRRAHDGIAVFRDMDRDNALSAAGVVVLRFGRADLLSRPCQVAWQIGSALQARGWLGEPMRCPRCRKTK